MQQTVNQLTLDIAVEEFSEREKRLIQHLKDFRTIDADIRAQQRLVDGIGLINEPRITPAGPERDYLPYAKHINIKRTQAEIEIAATVERHVNPGNVKGYATAGRVSRILRETFSDDKEEDMRLQDAYGLLTERHRETFDEPKLTDTEQVADRRLQERERAAVRLDGLLRVKKIVGGALTDMQEFHEEWYKILWFRYVQGEYWVDVCRIAARKGNALTKDEYIRARTKAIHRFDELTPGLIGGELYA